MTTSPKTSAVAKAAPAPAQVVDLGTASGEQMNVARRDDVERFEQVIDLPASFQYVIPARKKVNGVWTDVIGSIGITADGYDYLNRVLGVSFFLPDFVPDEHGEMVRNPIHRRDYLYVRMSAVWFNELGQLVGTTEDLEVDYQLVYQNARLETKDAKVVLDEQGQPIFDEVGNALLALASADEERKALKALMQLRTMGMRYAQTVLRTRLMKVAVGVKSLPVRDGQNPRPFKLRVVGFRDRMTPLERQAKAAASLGHLFGARPADAQPVTAAELAGIEAPNAEQEMDQTLLVATGVIADQPYDGEQEPDEFDIPVTSA